MGSDQLPVKDDTVIEPEVISNGAGEGPFGDYGDGPFSPPPPRPAGLLTRLKGLAAAALALFGAALLLLGAVLTSTVIGAILGIPLMLAGAAAFYLLFKLLGNSVVVRKF